MAVSQKRTIWAQQALQDVEGHEAPHGTYRESKRPQRFSSYVALMSHINDEPTAYEESSKHQVWKDAMTEEFQSIMKNDIWEVVPRTDGNLLVTYKWIFKIKHGADVSIEKHKPRFVAIGFSQKKGIDYDETFAPVARYTSIRTIIVIID